MYRIIRNSIYPHARSRAYHPHMNLTQIPDNMYKNSEALIYSTFDKKKKKLTHIHTPIDYALIHLI